MKKQLLTAIAICLSLCGYAQTKGTNALGFGVTATTSKSESYGYSGKNTNTSFNLSYGHFIKDNAKLGIEASYSKSKQDYTSVNKQEAKTYGGNVTYQKYFPIVKTLFAYAGARAGYSNTDNSTINQNREDQRLTTNRYALGAYGGVTWFVSKRFAFETSLLAADVAYSQTKEKANNSGLPYKNKSTFFDLSTQGAINNLGFKIYLLF